MDRNRTSRRIGWWIVALAVSAGLPSLRGGFLGGDDIQLVRDHVLVNRPSLEHAMELFSIVHRDLYQPVALLSFSADFRVKEFLGYPPQRGQHPAGVWVFHLTNVLIHALTAWLVFALVRRLGAGDAVAMVAAILFAIHPLGAEAVAWLNGRMMLLSTMFLLASVVLFDRWTIQPQWWSLALCLACVALCMMSKVRVSLPLLLLAPMVVRMEWPRRSAWGAWSGAVVITVVFAWINLGASSGMLVSGAQQLGDNRFARTFAALGWYLSRLIAPWGLSPNHPARPELTWTDAPTVFGVCVVLLFTGAWIVWMGARRASGKRLVLVAGVWFLASIAVTLPLVPSRNILVAQRYAYLPNVGLYLLIAVAVVAAYHRITGDGRTDRRPRSVAIHVFGVVLTAALLVGFWRTSGQYRNDVNRAERFAAVYPNEPGVFVQTGWAYYGDDRFADAEAAAQFELERHPDAKAGDAHQLIGMSRFKRGDLEGARRALERAVQSDPDSGIAHARLANVLAELNQTPRAIALYERAIALAPSYNPGRHQFAELLKSRGEYDAARRQYEAILQNNPYDAVAINALAQLDINRGDYNAALTRLTGLLDWMPENVAARVNAGLCYYHLGRVDEAANAYRAALAIDSYAGAAAINLANLLIEHDRPDEARGVLEAFLTGSPSSEDAKAILAVVRSANCLRKRQPQEAIQALEPVAAAGKMADDSIYSALTILLERHAVAAPDDPWPYYLLARAAIARDDADVVELAASEFNKRTDDPAEIALLDKLVSETRE